MVKIETTTCPGCWDETCQDCNPQQATEANGWQGKPSPIHGRLTALASPNQVNYLVKLGMDRADAEKLTKTKASDEIDRRKKAGQRPAASSKALDYLGSLMNERDVPADDLAAMEVAIGRGLDSQTCSQLIDECKSYPKLSVARGEQPLEDGMYRTPSGGIFKVYHTVHGANQQVAKRLVLDEDANSGWRFEYEGKAPLKGPDAIQPQWRMTLDQAKEFGAVYGVCCICSRTLTNEDSIEAGIGPVCAGRI